MSFAGAVEEIVTRPRFAGSRWGIAVFPITGGEAIYERDGGKPFVAASVTKVPSCLGVLDTLGTEYRFITPVARYGEVDAEGTLHGDLVLVGTGDPNLSNRVHGDTLTFVDVDHSYPTLPGTRPVAGDPMAVVRSLARSVYANGIRRVTGKIDADLALFQGNPGGAVSPVSVNDNLVDVRVTPGALGLPAGLEFAPVADCIAFENRTRTVVAGEPLTLRFANPEELGEPTRVTVLGDVPQGEAFWTSYDVMSPRRFAAALLCDALRNAGVIVEGRAPAARNGVAPVEVARHTSPPLREAIKVVLKVSHNYHARMLLRVCGGGSLRAGLRAVRTMMERAGVTVDTVAQADAAFGGGEFSPISLCRMLQYAATQPYADAFRAALPVLGIDGSLHDIQVGSRAAGRVVAKTGTIGFPDELNATTFLSAKSLAGYVEAASGKRYVFAAFVNNVHCATRDGAHEIGEALGEVAVAAEREL